LLLLLTDYMKGTAITSSVPPSPWEKALECQEKQHNRLTLPPNQLCITHYELRIQTAHPIDPFGSLR
ncbi:MAG: hypothetical protein II074_03035, partial [Ruminococcus sp.]|nr:hypothetical protein [Ruminococcus sp.]